MTLMVRLSRLIRADLNAVLDAVEDPASTLEQAIRDMVDALRVDEINLTRLREQRHKLEQQRDALTANHRRNEEEIDTCFEADEERLLRTLIKRRLQLIEHRKINESHLNECERHIATAESTLRENREKFAAMRSRAAAFVASEEAMDGSLSADCTATSAVTAEDIDIALLAEKRRRAQS